MSSIRACGLRWLSKDCWIGPYCENVDWGPAESRYHPLRTAGFVWPIRSSRQCPSMPFGHTLWFIVASRPTATRGASKRLVREEGKCSLFDGRPSPRSLGAVGGLVGSIQFLRCSAYLGLRHRRWGRVRQGSGSRYRGWRTVVGVLVDFELQQAEIACAATATGPNKFDGSTPSTGCPLSHD